MIKILISNLRVREKPTTDSKSLGYATKGNHTYTETKLNGYLWYHIENGWVANVDCIIPVPKEDSSKDQVFVSDVILNIRTEPSSKSTKVDICEENSFYDVLEISKQSDFNWYKIADRCWIAGVEEVEYIPSGTSPTSQLKNKIKELENSLSIVKECIEDRKCQEHYDTLYNKLDDCDKFIKDNFDTIEYDFITDKEFNEIDILNTTDVHGSWLGFDNQGCYNTPKFSYDDVGNYRDKLLSQGIMTFIVDCGDWSRPGKVEQSEAKESAESMNRLNYFLTTAGNHEWKWQWGSSTQKSMEILHKVNSMTMCNLFKNGKLVFKPYRTAKIGSKKLAVIGVGYPSPNGFGTYSNDIWSYDGYEFYDGDKLYNLVQSYIDELKGFDYILVATHMDKITEESLSDDNRFKARSDLLVQNTSGLTAVLQGHYNYKLNPQTLLDKKGNKVLICYNAGSNLDCFGRVRLQGTNVSSTLITNRGEL